MSGTTEDYGPGLQVDVLLPPEPNGVPAALVWHGRGPGERLVMRRFGVTLAELGIAVAVPDLRPFDADGGRSVLFDSVEWFEHRMDGIGTDPIRRAVVGWSYGARAAVGLVLSRPGNPFRRAVGLAGAYGTPPPTASLTPLELASHRHDVELLLVHGRDDPVHPPTASENLRRTATAAGIACDLVLVDTDHSGIVSASFEPGLGMSVPRSGTDPVGRSVAEATAAFIRRD